MWRHEQGHKFDQAKLETSMIKNYQFAKVSNICLLTNCFFIQNKEQLFTLITLFSKIFF